ncbi:MAG: methyltransferase 11 protein [Gammaproteobacteria bacterium]|nr:methyltransferase 11 protein [Gammaproteobacteria bacterium]
MKYRLLEILCCPGCSGDLRLDVFTIKQLQSETLTLNNKTASCHQHCGLRNLAAKDVNPSECPDCYNIEILEGKLSCQCGNIYPIIGGIPRLLPQELLHETLTQYHADFVSKYPDMFPVSGGRISESRKKIETMHAFGYQWTTFVRNFDYFREIFLSFVRPFLSPDDFSNRLVLEVGCGSGRPASIASSLGAEVVAVDLSEAVQTAYAQAQHYPRLHIIQADAYSLPVKPCFDFVYSVGVLQHLSDPQTAIKSIARAVPFGHKLVIWVYGKRELWYQPIKWLRKLTVKMPYRLLHRLSFVLAVLSEVFLLTPYRFLSRFTATQSFANKIPGHIYANFPFKENVLGWFDRLGAPVTYYFTKEDVERMLTNAGFHHINVTARPGASASWVAEATRLPVRRDS